MQPWQPSGYGPYGYQPYGYGLVPTPQYSYASFWRRLFALILDGILTTIVVVSLIAIIWSQTGWRLFTAESGGGGFRVSAETWPFAILTTAYYVILNGRGATIGKMVFAIRVTDRDGNPPGLTKSAIRQIIPSVGIALDPLLRLATRIAHEIGGWDAALSTGLAGTSILLGYGLIQIVDGLSMIWDDHKQTIHDTMAGTYVIRG